MDILIYEPKIYIVGGGEKGKIAIYDLKTL
jgi:hypothetical protein